MFFDLHIKTGREQYQQDIGLYSQHILIDQDAGAAVSVWTHPLVAANLEQLADNAVRQLEEFGR